MVLRTSSRTGRARSALHKLTWGARVVGWPKTALGLARLLRLRITKPEHEVIRLRTSGASLGFRYPSQVAGALVVFGDLIDPEYPFLTAIGRSDWIVFDVGAAIGQFTVFAAGPLGARVHTFEPSQANLDTLTENIRRNSLEDRVIVHDVALSDYSGVAHFEREPNEFMGHLEAGHGSHSGEAVQVKTLSSMAEEMGIDRVSVLKVNVAGGEPDVIAGAMPLLERGGSDVLVILIGPQTYGMLRRLADIGYRFFFYHPIRFRLYEVSSLDDDGLLHHQPWPARHVIGLWAPRIPEILRNSVSIAEHTRACARDWP